MHRGIKYNCRVFVYDRRIVLIRPKMAMANDGNYRERRWFTPWMRPRELDRLDLPPAVAAVTGQVHHTATFELGRRRTDGWSIDASALCRALDGGAIWRRGCRHRGHGHRRRAVRGALHTGQVRDGKRYHGVHNEGLAGA